MLGSTLARLALGIVMMLALIYPCLAGDDGKPLWQTKPAQGTLQSLGAVNVNAKSYPNCFSTSGSWVWYDLNRQYEYFVTSLGVNDAEPGHDDAMLYVKNDVGYSTHISVQLGSNPKTLRVPVKSWLRLGIYTSGMAPALINPQLIPKKNAFDPMRIEGPVD